MDFSLRSAFAHGTRALRTHIDSLPPQAAISWPVFARMRERWRGRIELQGSALGPVEMLLGEDGSALADLVAEHQGILGCVLEIDTGSAGRPRSRLRLGARARARARFPRRRDRRPGLDDAAARCRGGAALVLRGPRHLRPLLLARGAGRSRGRGDDPPRGARRARRSPACRCATSISRTASPGRTPRWRGVTLVRGARRRRRQGRLRQRQCPRSLLRLWRLRHARGLPRGGPHRASRSPARRLGRVGDPHPRRADAARGSRRDRARRAAPISCCSAPAIGASCSRDRRRTGS